MVVNLVFSHLGFWSRNLFLIAPFPDRCLLVPFPAVVLIVLCLDVKTFCAVCALCMFSYFS